MIYLLAPCKKCTSLMQYVNNRRNWGGWAKGYIVTLYFLLNISANLKLHRNYLYIKKMKLSPKHSQYYIPLMELLGRIAILKSKTATKTQNMVHKPMPDKCCKQICFNLSSCFKTFKFLF